MPSRKSPPKTSKPYYVTSMAYISQSQEEVQATGVGGQCLARGHRLFSKKELKMRQRLQRRLEAKASK